MQVARRPSRVRRDEAESCIQERRRLRSLRATMPGRLSMMTGESDTIAAHLKKAGVSRRSFLQLCSTLIVAAPVGLSLTSKATAAQVARICGQGASAVGDLAALPGLHGLHRDAAANVGSRRGPSDSGRDLPRLSRDADGCSRGRRRKRPCGLRSQTTPVSMCWWSKERFRRRMTGSTCNWVASPPFKLFKKSRGKRRR